MATSIALRRSPFFINSSRSQRFHFAQRKESFQCFDRPNFCDHPRKYSTSTIEPTSNPQKVRIAHKGPNNNYISRTAQDYKLGNLLQQDKIEEARSLVDELAKQNKPLSAELYNKFFRRLSENATSSQIIDYFTKMHQSFLLLPTGATCNILVSCLARNGDAENLARYWRLFVDGKEQPTLQTFHAILWAFAIAKQPQLAFHYFKQMPNFKITATAVTYHAMMLAFGKVGDTRAMLAYWADYLKKDFQPNLRVFDILLQGFQAKGDIPALLEYYKIMRNEFKLKPNYTILGVLLQSLSKNEKIEEMFNILEECLSDSIIPKEKIFQSFLYSFATKKDLESMSRVFQELEKFSVTPTLEIFNIMIDTYAKVDNKEQMLEYYKSMAKYNIAPDKFTISSIMHAFSKQQDVGSMKKLWKAAREQNIVLDPVLATTMLLSFARNNEVGVLENLVKQLQHSEVKVEDINLLSALVYAYSVLQDPVNLLKTFRTIRDSNKSAVNVALFNHVLDGLGRSGRLEEMDKYFYEMNGDLSPDAFSYCIVINAHLVAGNLNSAMKFTKLLAQNNIPMDRGIQTTLTKLYNHMQARRENSEELPFILNLLHT